MAGSGERDPDAVQVSGEAGVVEERATPEPVVIGDVDPAERARRNAAKRSPSRLDFDTEEEPAFFQDPRRLIQTVVVVLLLIGAIYVLFPRIVGLDGAISQLDEGDPVWLAIAFIANLLAFAAYVALFKGVVGEQVVRLTWSESYQVTMAGLAATRLFSAGGAGGIVLTYWALRKAGMERRTSANRMVAFLMLLYSIYLLTVVIDGILLRTGVFNGPNPPGLTVVPAAIAGGVLALLLVATLIPHDLDRRVRRATGRFRAVLGRLAAVPAVISAGIRTAIGILRDPRRGWLALIGAIGFWAANIAILWASFHAFDVQVPLGVVVQGFFIGMVANLIPFAPGGVGAVDAGMIGAFVLFGLDGDVVFPAVLMYRVIAFWLPIPPGIVAFLQLRRTVARWEAEGRSTQAMTAPTNPVPATS